MKQFLIIGAIASMLSLSASPLVAAPAAKKKTWYTYWNGPVKNKPRAPDDFDPAMHLPEDPSLFRWRLSTKRAMTGRESESVPSYDRLIEFGFAGSFVRGPARPTGLEVEIISIAAFKSIHYYQVKPSDGSPNFWVAGDYLQAEFKKPSPP